MKHQPLRFRTNRLSSTWVAIASLALIAGCAVAPAATAPSANGGQDDVARHVAEFTSQWKLRPHTQDSRFGIIRILSTLNLDHPGMAKVKAASASKNYDAAEKALLEYFKATREAMTASPKLDDRSRLVADQALAHMFRGNGDTHPPVFRGNDIDWTNRAFANGKEIHDLEWYFQFQRLTWWPSLAKAFAATGDARYFNEWRYELVNWADKLLPFSKSTPGFVTRGMETDIRCGQMSLVFPDMLRSPDFDSKTLLYFLGSFHEQAEHLPMVYAAIGNHRLGELSRVFRNALAFPEFKRAGAWKNDAITLLPKMMEDSVYADGMNKELVFSYHTMYIGLFANVYKMFNENGCGNLLPDFYYPRLLKMADIYAMQTFPDFSICQFGDGWKGSNAGSLFSKDKDMGIFAKELPYAGLKHRRTVLFVDKRYFVIHDEAIGADAGKVRIHFQFAPCEFEQQGLTAQTMFKEGANLLVRTFQQQNKILAEKEDGWISYKINSKEPRPAWSWMIEKTSEMESVDYLTTVIPFPKGATPEQVEASVSGKDGRLIFKIRDARGPKTVRMDLNEQSIRCDKP